MTRRGWFGSLLLLVIIAIGAGLGLWKYESIQASAEASTSQPEPMESVMVATAREMEHQPTTTSIGTVLALQSITLKNELPGTVHHVTLTPGQIVDKGALLVALDVSVEEAELKAQEAQAALAKSVLNRRHNLNQEMATTQEEVDRARADLDIALAQIARTQAIIARKTIRAPFKARVGIADVHPGQYLNEGTQLTTLQGIGDAVHVDFTVAQHVAASLREDGSVDVFVAGQTAPITAQNRRPRCAHRPNDPQRNGAGKDQGGRPGASSGGLGACPSSGRSLTHGYRYSCQRPAQRTGRRSSFRHPAG